MILPPLPPLTPEEQEHLPSPKVSVKQIVVTGNTVFSETQIRAVTDKYIGRDVMLEELEELRLALSRLYIEQGYINSGALLPDQSVKEGIIRFEIIEGELTTVTVTGNKWFRTSYLRKRLMLDMDSPLKISALQERLQYLQQDERISRLQAELRPGGQMGTSELHAKVEETFPFALSLQFNNYQSPSVGAERVQLIAAHHNLTGYGDVLQVTAGYSEGIDLQLDAIYTVPLNARDTTASFSYEQNSSNVVEEPFDDLDIKSKSEIFTLTLRHPVYRTLRRELALSFIAERLHSETFLFSDQRFEFSAGTDQGRATVTTLRLAVEWIDRTSKQVIAVRSRFSLGVDLLGATINSGDVPTGQYFAWLGQLQWGRRLPIRDLQLLFRLDMQFTTEPLFSLEQIAVGGRFSVRGYRENQLVRDHGIIASLEASVPLIQNLSWADYIQLVPFVDVGWGSNQGVMTPDPTTLLSVGLGLRWGTRLNTSLGPLRPQFEIYWGQKLKDVDTQGGNLQDRGVHLQFAINMF